MLPPGDVRKEILANIDRQFSELQAYFADFERILADCASCMEYDRKAHFVGSRYRTLFTPVMTQILAPEGGRPAGDLTSP